jgi:hypothetical protein
LGLLFNFSFGFSVFAINYATKFVGFNKFHWRGVNQREQWQEGHVYSKQLAVSDDFGIENYPKDKQTYRWQIGSLTGAIIHRCKLYSDYEMTHKLWRKLESSA